MRRQWKFLSLFAGSGGGSLGFTNAGWECVGAFDSDERACRDHEYLTGHPAHEVDLGAIQPHELAARCTGRPDVVFTSPPCKGFSACQSIKRSRSEKYIEMNSLAQRGVALAIEAWSEPPPIILMENVPRVLTRGKEWLDIIQTMLRAEGYACALTKHDCGEWGHLAQHRDRVLLVARHMEQVPHFLCEPPSLRVRGIGEVLMDLPVPLPGGNEGGPMHVLPELAPINWVRLALIRARKDWRDLPEAVALGERSGRQNGGFGVNDFEEGAHTIVSEGSVRNTWSSVNDPRITCKPRSTVYGVADADEALGTVVAAAKTDNGMFSIADPRVERKRREGGHGVRRWDDASHPVIGAARIHNWPASVGDPRVTHDLRRGNLSVIGWAQASHTVIGDARCYKGANVADPRPIGIVGSPPLVWRDKKVHVVRDDGTTSASRTHLVIMAADGTWHRPMTTLELAVLQGLPARHRGDWLKLDGNTHGNSSDNKKTGWRTRIGNMVPPPTAEAIARAMADVLEEAAEGGKFRLVGAPIWVDGDEQPEASP